MNSEQFFNAVAIMRAHQIRYRKMCLEKVPWDERKAQYRNKMYFQKIVDDEIERVTRIMKEREAK